MARASFDDALKQPSANGRNVTGIKESSQHRAEKVHKYGDNDRRKLIV